MHRALSALVVCLAATSTPAAGQTPPLVIRGSAGTCIITLPTDAVITQTATSITITWGTPKASVRACFPRVIKTPTRKQPRRFANESSPYWVDAGPANNWFGYGSKKEYEYAAQTAIPAGD